VPPQDHGAVVQIRLHVVLLPVFVLYDARAVVVFSHDTIQNSKEKDDPSERTERGKLSVLPPFHTSIPWRTGEPLSQDPSPAARRQAQQITGPDSLCFISCSYVCLGSLVSVAIFVGFSLVFTSTQG
jgi:hypothetical protein